mmetsp:Transcript_24721/g.37637  ORF Transcript_24721/g.37637 Transcript_24721/m.37637 type:complete len:260 (-) Transcript_24721:1151-1930(-)
MYTSSSLTGRTTSVSPFADSWASEKFLYDAVRSRSTSRQSSSLRRIARTRGWSCRRITMCASSTDATEPRDIGGLRKLWRAESGVSIIASSSSPTGIGRSSSPVCVAVPGRMVAPMDPGTAEVGDMTTVDGGTLESDNRGGARGGGEGLAEGVWGSFIGVSGGDWRVKERRGWFVWGSKAPRGSVESKLKLRWLFPRGRSELRFGGAGGIAPGTGYWKLTRFWPFGSRSMTWKSSSQAWRSVSMKSWTAPDLSSRNREW